VLSDLTVEEDPAYGAEPVLHASTVTAPIRLLPLWRGRLEIDKISVDDASLNLVRTAAGRWNLDPLLRTATTQSAATSGQSRPVKLPYLEATSSRINIKNGAEKLPFSVINADISFWQESPASGGYGCGASPHARTSALTGRHGHCAPGGDTAPVGPTAPDAGAPGPGMARGANGQLTRLILGPTPAGAATLPASCP